MKRVVWVLVLAVTAVVGSANFSGVPTEGHPYNFQDSDFKVFWEKFKSAVIKVDKNTVASLTRYPLGMSYGIRSIKTKAELLRRYREVFNQQTDAAKCFSTKEPGKNESNPKRYTVVCPNEAGDEVVAFDFEKGKLGWRFVSLDNYNE
jgi:hypothetical protein